MFVIVVYFLYLGKESKIHENELENIDKKLNYDNWASIVTGPTTIGDDCSITNEPIISLGHFKSWEGFMGGRISS